MTTLRMIPEQIARNIHYFVLYNTKLKRMSQIYQRPILLTEISTHIINHVPSFMWDVATHPCLTSKPRLKWEQYGPLARYVKLPWTFSPPPRVSDPDMHHGTCVTHVPWCIPGSLTNGFLWSRWRENVPGIAGACANRNFTYVVRGPLSNYTHSCVYVIIHAFPTFNPGFANLLAK